MTRSIGIAIVLGFFAVAPGAGIGLAQAEGHLDTLWEAARVWRPAERIEAPPVTLQRCRDAVADPPALARVRHRLLDDLRRPRGIVLRRRSVPLRLSALDPGDWRRADHPVRAVHRGAPQGRRVDRYQHIQLRQKPAGYLGTLIVGVTGVTFAIGGTPCVGPILGSILSLAGTAETRRARRGPARRLLGRPRVPFPLSSAGLGAFLKFFRRTGRSSRSSSARRCSRSSWRARGPQLLRDQPHA